jgi:t-SNARE complex subunit (syntaxin)
LLKSEFDTFVKTCNEISKNIEEALKRELMKPEDDDAKPGDKNTNLILRYQKIMAEQKRKLKNLSSKKQQFIVEEAKVDRRNSEDQEEQMGLIDNELESMDDFVKTREQQIIKIHRDITLVNQISEEITILVNKQSEDLDVVDKHMTKANENVKKANKELLKAADKKGINKKKYMKIIGGLLGVIFVFMLMAYYR